MKLFDATQKKTFMLTYLKYPYGQLSGLSISYSLPFSHKVFDYTFFIGLRLFYSSATQFHYTIYVDAADNTLKGVTYIDQTIVAFRGFAYYGYTCPDGFYFS